MDRPTPVAFATLAMLAPLACTLPGCFGSSSVKHTGAYVGESTYSQIKVGETKDQWVRGALGDPTMITSLGDGAEMWRWEWQRTAKASGAAVPMLSGGSASEETSGSAWVQIQNGVVVNKGRDAIEEDEFEDDFDDD